MHRSVIGTLLTVFVMTGCSGVLGLDETLPASVDPDHDGFADDDVDNCPAVENRDQADGNGDGIGDACSTYCTGRCADATTCACVDFDDSPDPPPDWDLLIEGTATGSITTRDVKSAPRALYLTVPAGLAEGQRNLATFMRGLLAPDLHIVYEADWKLSYYEEIAKAHTVQFISVSMANVANTTVGYSYNGSTGLWFIARAALGLPSQIYPIARPPTNESTWTHVRFDVRFSNTGTGHAYVAFDGIEVVHEDNLTNAPPTSGPQTLNAMAIAWTLQGNTPFVDTLYDNLIFTVD